MRDLALQIASEEPKYISISDVPSEVVFAVEKEAETTALALGKPEKAILSIKAGKTKKFLSKVCLMEQKFIKDPSITISNLVQSFAANCGENIKIVNFCRFQIPN